MTELKTATWMMLALSLMVGGCGGGGSGDGDGGGDGSTDATSDVIVTDGPGDTADAGDTGDDDGGGSQCPSGDCDLVGQTGCEEGNACYFLMTGEEEPAPTCQPAGEGEQGASCETYQDCAPGHECQGGLCLHYCCGDEDETSCPDGSLCFLGLGEEGHPMAYLCGQCDECDLPAQTGCGDGEGCYLASANGCKTCIPSASDLPEGSECAPSNDCVPGLGCIGVPDGSGGTTPTCARFCPPEGESTCMDGQTCTPVNGIDGVGVCLPPAEAGGG